jgi:hypothetical protein
MAKRDEQRVLKAVERAAKELDYRRVVEVARLSATCQVQIDNSQYSWDRPLGLTVLPTKKNAFVG